MGLVEVVAGPGQADVGARVLHLQASRHPHHLHSMELEMAVAVVPAAALWYGGILPDPGQGGRLLPADGEAGQDPPAAGRGPPPCNGTPPSLLPPHSSPLD